MRKYDKQQFQTRIINIMKKNSPENSVEIISKLNNPITGEKIGKKKAIRIYVVNVEDTIDYDEDLYGNNMSKYNALIGKKLNRIHKII